MPNHEAADIAWAKAAVYSLVTRLQPSGAPQDPDGWIDWHGGICPIPDAPAFGFEVRQRNGMTDRPTVNAPWYGWQHRGDDHDIVAYRLISLAPREASPEAREQ